MSKKQSINKKKRQEPRRMTHLSKNAIQSLSSQTESSTLEYYKQSFFKLGLQDFLHTFSGYFARQIGIGLHSPHFHESHRDTPNSHATNSSNSASNHTYTDSQNLSMNLFANPKKLAHILHIPSFEKLRSLIESLEQEEQLRGLELPKIALLDAEILSLAKGGVLRLFDIYQCLQMVRFFYNCTRIEVEQSYLRQYFQSFVFPAELLELMALFHFDSKQSDSTKHDIWHGAHYLKEGADDELNSLLNALRHRNKEKQGALYRIIGKSSLQEYLVDTQIHFFENTAALLVRAGYANVLQGRVVGRSAHGFFYIVPLEVEHIESQIHALKDKVEARLLFLAKEYSKILSHHVHFLRFIHTEYDFMDRACARLHFARDYNLSFVFPSNTQKGRIELHEYAHPSLHNPIPISVVMERNLLMITGVNAGGKTMLLKSILSALWCAKLLIPMRINAHKSSIPYSKNIHIIAQDPQDSHNDISTFSGRIQEISAILHQKDCVLGIDEIEIGTDSSEAASLYKVLLEHLLNNNAKIIVTTHHKHLAALMADNPQTKLLAALYDYERGRPTYCFIEGIGKSYAMECALVYGIPKALIDEARRVHGDEANKLERLIEESNIQITRNKQDELRLQELKNEQEQKIAQLEKTKRNLMESFEKQSLELKRHYNEAIKEIKMLARQSDMNLKEIQKRGFDLKELDSKELRGTQEIVKDIHKLLNKAHKNEEKSPKISIESSQTYSIGQSVRYQDKIATILECQKNGYTIELQNGVRLKGIQAAALSKAQSQPTRVIARTYELQADIRAQTKLDLHGYTKEEALELLEDFLSHAIMARLSEVMVVHGLGNGILKRTIEQFLEGCPYIRGYVQAPPNMGGLGAKIIYLHT